jgi:hypothetical protein
MHAIVTTLARMMAEVQTLIDRLAAIGHALRGSGHAQALIGLGSVGVEIDRLDAWSDLDFFVITQPGHKNRYLHNLDWLAAAHPLAWSFQNTADGHKALMADGVFCEFAVFEPDELANIPFAPGRVVWKAHGVADGIATPRKAVPAQTPPTEDWIVGEALSCLFIGLQRWHRGERLSAARFVQSHALDRLLELDALRHPAQQHGADPFNRDRRLEARSPQLQAELAQLVPGYLHTPQAALAMLAALGSRGATLNPRITELIVDLARPPTH